MTGCKAVLTFLIALTAVESVLAQPPPGQPPGGGPAPGLFVGQPGFFPPPPFQMGGSQGAALAISEKFKLLFVVKGNTLYQFNLEDLTLIKKVELEEQPEGPPPPPGGFGGGAPPAPGGGPAPPAPQR